jgi:hypothetical protein
MAKSASLPKLTAPPFRETTSAKTWTSYLKGDLKEVIAQAAVWVQTKTVEVIKEQHDLGNSKQFIAVVDGSKSKPINQAQRKVVVYFVSAVLTRYLSGAKEMLQKNILRSTMRRTGLLADGWTWYLQVGGKGGSLTSVGGSLPTNIRIRAGDALILAPTAKYAWFGNAAAVRGSIQRKLRRRDAEERKFQMTGKRRSGKPIGNNPGGEGFMAKTAKQLRPQLKRVGFRVTAGFTKNAPPGPSSGWPSTRRGIPILIFYASRGVSVERG